MENKNYFCIVVPHSDMNKTIWITDDSGRPVVFPTEDQIINYVNYLIFLEKIEQGYMFIYDYNDFDLIRGRDHETFKEWLIKESYFDKNGISLNKTV